MSDHKSDSEESYQTDDSDIKEYPELANSGDGSSDEIERGNVGLAYADSLTLLTLQTFITFLQKDLYEINKKDSKYNIKL